ncbi:hypothetical protein PG985_013094 [Apiospora marii]|uniref:Uncharacterized protein n=1 Tax=Apiospora marii TaxID=335849 RepID=A0ABR1RBL7_9PEZI
MKATKKNSPPCARIPSTLILAPRGCDRPVSTTLCFLWLWPPFNRADQVRLASAYARENALSVMLWAQWGSTLGVWGRHGLFDSSSRRSSADGVKNILAGRSYSGNRALDDAGVDVLTGDGGGEVEVGRHDDG